jgi:UDP:flavonoid glycosyltransferase YjiC (YdhE family)
MSCDVVVTHGGSGTTTAALTRGLPMVVVPLFADQMHNADRVAAAGVGMVVDGRRAATDLAPAVRRVLAEESFARAAQGVAAELRALPSAGEVLAAVRPAGIH